MYLVALRVGVGGVVGADQVKGWHGLLQYGAAAVGEVVGAVAGAGDNCEHNYHLPSGHFSDESFVLRNTKQPHSLHCLECLVSCGQVLHISSLAARWASVTYLRGLSRWRMGIFITRSKVVFQVALTLRGFDPFYPLPFYRLRYPAK